MHADGYRVTKLVSLCERITVGHVGRMKDEYVPDGIPFLRSQNITPFRLETSDLRFISPAFHSKLRKSVLRPGDVAIVRTGYPGTACVIPPSLPESNCADLVVITPSDQLNAYYLAALFNSSWGQATVRGRLVGAAQQHFNVTVAKEMEVRLPPRATQDQLVAILSAYNELIENNLRRIRILEEMARAIYREWFVHFRFPGHEAVDLVDSPLGPFPEGWEVVSFTDLANVLSGGTPKTDVQDYWGGTIPFFTPKDAPTGYYVSGTEKTITETGLANCASLLYPRDTVFITARGTVGKLALASVPMAVNQSCYALQGRVGIKQRFLFQLAMEQVAYLRTNTGGATFATIVVDTFRRMRVTRPPRKLIEAYTQSTDSMYDLADNLERQIANLRTTRDLLLPRLMSGQLTLPEVKAVAQASF